ncbi:MAG TPA: cupin domain-containing protein [Puia sp.]|jgi:mannose-6-phosphate isomerase-like protein (cupin superfamily)|nr:cupin domain-containing protein [Puia sp.]
MKVSKETGRHYVWGGTCDGWGLVETDLLSVIEERIPSRGGEVLHYHVHAQQLFYILSGVATFETDGFETTVDSGEGYHVRPGTRHRIRNLGVDDLRFLVVSQPKSHGDRVNI